MVAFGKNTRFFDAEKSKFCECYSVEQEQEPTENETILGVLELIFFFWFVPFAFGFVLGWLYQP